MSTQPNQRLNIALWTAQIVLAGMYGFASFMKLTQSMPDLAEAIHWPAVFPEIFVRGIGAIELAGAIGLIMPMLTKIQPRLTVHAAFGFVVLQIFAIIYHIPHGEFSVLPLNLVLLTLAAFILWGRGRKFPLGIPAQPISHH